MATSSDVYSIRATLSTTTPDERTLTGVTEKSRLLVTNEDSAELLSFSIDGSTPTQGGDDLFHVPAGLTLELDSNSRQLYPSLRAGSVVVKLVGNGNTYIVQVV